ncbi:hypothetical protein LTR53_004395 [Teratosphaeriaceae sp. CCFEE 6253]|nr:hypothetical protein LTR53_004395 [Teratosphaeriaceae sp. CCFEE 6253]
MWQPRTHGTSPWQRSSYSSHPKPPEPRAYRPLPPTERSPKPPAEPSETTKSPQQNFIRRLFSTRSEPHLPPPEPADPARGLEASRRVVMGGVLDPRYRSAAWRVTAAMCAMPFAIYLSYELFERRFRGKEQRVRPVRMAGGEGDAT